MGSFEQSKVESIVGAVEKIARMGMVVSVGPVALVAPVAVLAIASIVALVRTAV